ncbi:MAG: hypothetical protein IJ017_05295 [Oscillospiraceae bacterium]|nr:hypothetical protein [Oscillospiraceae bacterium]
MKSEVNSPREGDLHSIVTIGTHSFELRYGYCDDCDRFTDEPYILYPDLLSKPFYTEEGCRIVTALQSICKYYEPINKQEREDCCYTCSFYPNQHTEIGICKCDGMRKPVTESEEA